MNGRLKGRRALITGASSGIGRAIAEAFITEGADVFITARTDEAVVREVVGLAAGLGQRCGYALMSAASTSADTLFDEANVALGPIDILVNNPAFITRTSFLDLSGEEDDQTLTVNLRFPFFCDPTLRKRLHRSPPRRQRH